MASIFHESAGQAVIENTSAAGTEQLIVTLHPESGFSVEFEFKEGLVEDALIASSGISIDRQALQQLVRWLRELGAVD